MLVDELPADRKLRHPVQHRIRLIEEPSQVLKISALKRLPDSQVQLIAETVNALLNKGIEESDAPFAVAPFLVQKEVN